jgi:type II secretory pathway pseudopilin PulG
MHNTAAHVPHAPRPPARQRGFALMETVLVMGLLGLVAAGLLSLQPRVHATQNEARDQYAGLEIQRACAERLLGARRQLSFTSVSATACNGLGGVAGFASNPGVTLRDAAGSSVAACTGATCTATIVIARTSGAAAPLPALTLQLSAY